jgi:hypothetical protein
MKIDADRLIEWLERGRSIAGAMISLKKLGDEDGFMAGQIVAIDAVIKKIKEMANEQG